MSSDDAANARVEVRNCMSGHFIVQDRLSGKFPSTDADIVKTMNKIELVSDDTQQDSIIDVEEQNFSKVNANRMM